MACPLQSQAGDVLLDGDAVYLLKDPVKIGAVQSDGVGYLLNRDIFIIRILYQGDGLFYIVFLAGERFDLAVALHQFGAEQIKLAQRGVSVGDGCRVQGNQRFDDGYQLSYRLKAQGGGAAVHVAQLHKLPGIHALEPDPVIDPGVQHIGLVQDGDIGDEEKAVTGV